MRNICLIVIVVVTFKAAVKMQTEPPKFPRLEYGC